MGRSLRDPIAFPPQLWHYRYVPLCPDFSCRSWGSNSGLHACGANPFPVKPSPQTLINNFFSSLPRFSVSAVLSCLNIFCLMKWELHLVSPLPCSRLWRTCTRAVQPCLTSLGSLQWLSCVWGNRRFALSQSSLSKSLACDSG